MRRLQRPAAESDPRSRRLRLRDDAEGLARSRCVAVRLPESQHDSWNRGDHQQGVCDSQSPAGPAGCLLGPHRHARSTDQQDRRQHGRLADSRPGGPEQAPSRLRGRAPATAAPTITSRYDGRRSEARSTGVASSQNPFARDAETGPMLRSTRSMPDTKQRDQDERHGVEQPAARGRSTGGALVVQVEDHVAAGRAEHGRAKTIT